MQKLSPTLQILMARFDGAVLIPFVAASETIGIPEHTARNQLWAGRFPIKTVLIGPRRFVHINDLANFVDSLGGEKQKRGARTKKERIEQGRPL